MSNGCDESSSAATNPLSTTVFRGDFVHTPQFGSLEAVVDGCIGVDSRGVILFVEKDSNQLPELSKKFSFDPSSVVRLGTNQFLTPGLIDTHIHAPQFLYSGNGTDLPLLKWLERYTFPTEARYTDLALARRVYTACVNSLVSYGTTTAVYFATIHKDASLLLADLVEQIGQRGYIGKVCMDRNSPDFYREDTAQSLRESQEIVEAILAKQNPLVQPVVTPRFVPSCSTELMKGLGKIVKKYSVPVQSHVSENKDEVAWVASLHPECRDYLDVYDKAGLLTPKTVMAHAVHLTDSELKRCHETGTGLSHCPVSNFTLSSGVFNTRKALASGVKVGLGTDVSGGYSSSLWVVMREAVTASQVVFFANPEQKPLSFKEAFYLATQGGASLIGEADRLGTFAPGKNFDALVVDPSVGSMFLERNRQETEEEWLTAKFEKMFFQGDDRNVLGVFVQGRKIHGRT